MTDILLLTFVFLAAGVLVVPIASHFSLGSVLGYLIAGILISPLLTLFNVNVSAIQHIAEFGVVMMLFLIGLELEPRKLWSMRARLLGLGGGQILLTTGAVTAIGIMLDQPWSVSFTIGLIFSLSSTAIVLQTLTERGLLKSDGGQASLAVLLMQDIAVIPMLALVPLLALPELVNVINQASSELAPTTGQSLSLIDGLNSWQVALVTIAAVGTVVLGGNYLISPIFRFISLAHLRELFTATALMFVIGIALLMSLVGLSPALGTFLAGVVLANSAYKHELESNIAPFKGLLLGLFFMTVGAGINFHLLTDNFLLIVSLTLGLIAVKAIVMMLLALIFKLHGAHKWLFALGLSQAGEFGFVLLSFTVHNGVIPADISELLLLVVALSMLLTPLLFIIYDKVIAKQYNKTQAREADEINSEANIIIAGSGRMGLMIDRLLRAAGFDTTVIDYSSERLEILKRFRLKTYFGDATRPDLLTAAGIDEAKLLIVAIDETDKISKLVKYVSENYPHVHIVSRATDNNHVYDLYAHGCRDIIRETHDSSLRMGRSAFEALGIVRDKAEKMIDVFNDHEKKLMLAVADAHKLGVPNYENEEYIARMLTLLEEWEPAVGVKMQAISAEASADK